MSEYGHDFRKRYGANKLPQLIKELIYFLQNKHILQ